MATPCSFNVKAVKKLIYSLVLIFIVAFPGKASHIVGAEITYECLGGNEYEFTLNIYRDCLGESTESSYNLQYYSNSCGYSADNAANFTVYRVEGPVEVSPVCATAPSTCEDREGGEPGIEFYSYKGTVTFPEECEDWVVFYETIYRNAAISNIVQPWNEGLVVRATLNNTVGCNNSPYFTNHPVSFLTANDNNSINFGTVEQDGDELHYEATAPLNHNQDELTYKNGFSSGSPITSDPPMTVDPSNGTITLNPGPDEQTVSAIKVTETRNGKVIGSVMRDMQIISQDRTNSLPSVTGMDGTDQTEITVCPGETVFFEVTGSDPDEDQGVILQDNNTIPGAFTAPTEPEKNPVGQFQWTPTHDDIGTNSFTVTVIDEFCPTPGSNQKAFTINVADAPVADLPPDQNIPCDRDFTLEATVTGGQPPYSYNWDTGETTPSIDVSVGKYKLNVTDANGCSSEPDSVNLYNGVLARFEPVTGCSGSAYSFEDLSTSTGDITEWEWDFGDGSGSDEQDPDHIYASAGEYYVSLTVTDENGCSDEMTTIVGVCDPPVPDFAPMDSCQQKSLPVADRTESECGISRVTLSVGSVSKTVSFPDTSLYYPGEGHRAFSVIPEESGEQTVKYTVENSGGCIASITRSINLFERPNVRLQENDHYVRCDDPDTLLHAINIVAKEPYELSWSNNDSDADTSLATGAGEFTVTVTDSNNCIHKSTVDRLIPIKPRIEVEDICVYSDTANFEDVTVFYWTPVKWEWDFGDGETETYTTPETGTNVKHVYASQDTFQVKLKVTDNTGCTDSMMFDHTQYYPDDQFSVTPDSLCFGEVVDYRSPSVATMDSLIWTFGNGYERYLNEFHSADENGLYSAGAYIYPSGSAGEQFTITSEVFYNKREDPDSVDHYIYCVREFTDSVYIYPELEVEMASENYCVGDTTEITAEQIAGSPIYTWDWKLYRRPLHEDDHNHDPVKVNSSDKQNWKHEMQEQGNYFAELTVTTTDECQVTLPQHPFPGIEVPQPNICVEGICEDRQTRYFYLCNEFPEIMVDSVYWSFGDPASGDDNTSNLSAPTHIYDEFGEYEITVTLFNNTFGCSADSIRTVTIFPLPEAGFNSADAVCMGQPVNFVDQSVPGEGDEIQYWTWSYGDGDSSASKDPVHYYKEPGQYQVSLNVSDETSGCVSDTIEKTVTVFPAPEAGFYTAEDELVTERPVKFFDESSGAVEWLWHFGDGDSLYIESPPSIDPEHIYSAEYGNVTAEQIVYNEYACSDTAIQELDLKVYLLLPNAFTPNEDNNNDGLFLIHKGIGELLEYRIFNRWGEVVFDAEGDLENGWDGTYKGADQPVGVYLYHAKARSLVGEEIEISGKVSLIR